MLVINISQEHYSCSYRRWEVTFIN